MTRDEAKQIILRDLPARELERDKSKKGYICPICGSGSGSKGTGITENKKAPYHFTCWAGCFTNTDIIEIVGLKYGLTEYNDMLEKSCELCGINYNELESDIASMISLARARADFREDVEPAQKQDKNGQYTDNTQHTDNTDSTDKTDYVEYFKECAKHRSECDYLVKRGISEATQAIYLIGYDKEWRSPKAIKKGSNPPATPRVIIPTSRESYIARDTRPAESLNDYEKQFSKMKEGALSIFNIKALESMQAPLIVVEGEIDALSIIEIGYQAIALGSTTNYKKLISYCMELKPTKPLLIALDNDKSGKETTTKLVEGLRANNIECYAVNICGSWKDANEALVADREAFTNLVADAIASIKDQQEQEKLDYLKTSTSFYMKDFINGIAESVNTPYVSTGFSDLDNILDGGLYEGLYVIGAISSLGKTTFTLQVADQIAKSGRDVLIFSLEMARNELIAKSVSRTTAQLALLKQLPIETAKTVRGITVANFYKGYTEQERELIQESLDRYSEYANNVYINEGMGEVGVKEVREIVEKHIRLTGKTPIVIIDYLQILAPYEVRATDKQNTDRAILELKRISRDFKLPLLAISSFNRDNYNMGVSMQAFKESGAIEYSADVLLGLQLAGAGKKEFDVDQAKAKNPREIELKILKNRNGKTGAKVELVYYPQYNYFIASDNKADVWSKIDEDNNPFS